MTDTSIQRTERIAASAYFLGIQFLALPVVDYVMNVWPIQMGAVNWRYGAAGLAGGFLLTPLLGFLILLGTALAFGHRRAQKAVGVLGALVGVALLLVSAILVFDALQLRGAVDDTAKWMFDAGVFKALVKNIAGGLFCILIAIGAFKRDDGVAQAAKGGRSAPDPLIVGSRPDRP